MNSPPTPLSLLTMSPAQTYDQSGGEHVGPHPSYIELARLYISETRLQERLKSSGSEKEDSIRLHGVAWIDSVRKALKLPVRTFDTAVVYFHKFRLAHSENDYGPIDAVAAAALFTACKVEDTQKRSRDILCAAHNLKLPPSEHVPPDDSRFEPSSKAVLGLERLMLESSCFDFRSQSPQKVVIKLLKSYPNINKATVGKTAYDMSLDLYRTFAPMKHTTQTLAIACVELAGNLHGEPVEALEVRGYRRWHTSREEVMETLQDLLDLYTDHRATTIVGQNYPVESFIAVRIPLNQECTREELPRHYEPYKPAAVTPNGSKASNGKNKGPPSSRPSPTSPADSLRTGTDASPATPRSEREARAQGTVRFMLDGERAQEEKATVDKFFRVEVEDYEVEVEVPVASEKKARERVPDRPREPKEHRDRERERGYDRRDRDYWDRRRF